MKPCFVVLTDFSPAAERARAYAAALAAPLGAELHLIHVFLPMPTTTEYGTVLPILDTSYVPDTRRSLEMVAAALPVPATAELLETSWTDAVEQALDKYHPLVLVAGLTATNGLLDEWLSNRALPLAHQTGYPLLLVPEHLPDAALRPPHRLALAVEDQDFRLAPGARAAAPMLDALGTEIVTLCVLTPEQRTGGWDGLCAAQRCGLASTMAHSGLHKVVSELPASGILQGVRELQADVLALLDRGHGWVHKLFSGSVTDHVLRHTRVPVLLLSAPTEAVES
ncbi:Universal stress protein family protein [Hymenobacter daecheongensis DSM 21074]|uniref:Universal stress protein family protein n=1 Tax=Hymenobacter daecheongensis DSM 21074 TaxID=1121955 RepID=A0A1M6MDR8_9BACT|nr:universal stress protein [Hymenobacter daecheongensis]SHJ81611.1 Universal stress protein family protein [Hymenobacter daecheongensis DSM 21074]